MTTLFLTFKFTKHAWVSLARIHNEKELLLKIAEGDHRSFARIFDAYHDGLFQFVYKITADTDLSKEILIDAFTSVWLSRKELPSLNNFLDWLFIVTRNQLLNILRKKRSSQVRIVRLEDHPRHYTDDKVQEHEYDLIMMKAIEQLPPKQQQAFRLSREEGFDNRTIANLMSISPESVKKYLQWANQSVIRFVKANTGIVIFIVFLESLK